MRFRRDIRDRIPQLKPWRGADTHEEIAIRIDGSSRGYQKGYLGCAMRVVPTFGDACTFSPIALGTILIKRT